MAGRRGNNEGSIYQVGDHWEASVTMRRGKRKRLRRATYAEAVIARDELIAERNSLRDVDRRLTVERLLDEYLEDLTVTDVHPRTWEAYESVIRLYIKPALGGHRAALLTPSEYRAFQNSLLREDRASKRPGLSPSYVSKIRTVLSGAYRWAMAEERVPRNPVEVIKPPKVPTYEARPLTVKETVAALEAIADHRHGPLWRFMIATGCRWQDAAGLLWIYVDTTNLLVIFVKAARRVPKRFRGEDGRSWEIAEQKTAASRRTHPLATLGMAALTQQAEIVADLRKSAGAKWQEHGLVFPSRIGTPLRNDHVGEQWDAAMAAAKLPDVRLHDLRHTMVTLQRRAGTDLRTIRDLVGHASTEMTDLYAGVVPEALREAVNRADRMLVAPGPQAGPADTAATKTATGDGLAPS